MKCLRIFSYLPNPRVWKATIAARFVGVDVEVRGAPSSELKNWLWDFDARPLTDEDRRTYASSARTGRMGFTSTSLFKTDAFMDAQPFGTVPAAFSGDGSTGIFESNSIMRAVARIGAVAFPLYGRDPYEASRIDSFLDASLVFARDTQIYLLALYGGTVDQLAHSRAKQAFEIYVSGLERALSPTRSSFVGDNLTLADICFCTEIALLMNERSHSKQLSERGLSKIVDDAAQTEFPRVFAHFRHLVEHEHFKPDIKPYLEKLSAAGP